MKQDLYENLVNYIIENQKQFYRLAYSYVRKEEDALDVVQNAICKALEHYGTLKNTQALRTWFYRILVNESLLFLSRKKEELFSEDGEEEMIPYHEKGYEKEDGYCERK